MSAAPDIPLDAGCAAAASVARSRPPAPNRVVSRIRSRRLNISLSLRDSGFGIRDLRSDSGSAFGFAETSNPKSPIPNPLEDQLPTQLDLPHVRVRRVGRADP